MVDVLSAEAVVDHLVQLRGRGRGPVQVEERINPKKNDYKSVRVCWSVGWSVCHNFLKRGGKLHFHAFIGVLSAIPPALNVTDSLVNPMTVL